MTYQETLDFLFSRLPMFHRIGKAAYKATLDNTIALDKYFGHPHRKFKTIHIAGTNGKGSVSHMIASVLQAAGYKTGLYTSPHLKDFRERIKINGVTISKKDVTDFVAHHKEIFEDIKPSFFEMTVALAFDYFARQNIDVAVVETGLGGRLDSTNIISPELSVITNISFDHTDLLGNTMEKIAYEKAGIIKPETPVVIGETQQAVKQIFVDTAYSKKAPLYFAGDFYFADFISISANEQRFNIFQNKNKQVLIYENLATDLLGSYQKKNIVTALKSIDILIENGFKITKQDIYSGFATTVKNTGLMGRWQILNTHPLTICDTGHNPAGIEFIIDQIKNTPHKKLHFILGAVNDKDIDGILSLLPKDAVYYFTKANIPRALDEKILAEKAAIFNLTGKTFSTVKNAIDAAKQNAEKDDLIFIGGSIFVVAEAL